MASEGKVVESLPPLEEPCSRCDRRGWRDLGAGRERCVCCDGAGYTPTRDGERVLTLLRHNLGPMLGRFAPTLKSDED